MAQWVAVHGFQNTEDVEEDILNRPIYELVERTNYLYDQIQDILGDGLFESVRVTSVALVTTGTSAPVVGDLVYLDPVANKYAKAIADSSSTDAFRAADSSFAVGLLVTAASGVGTVVLYGRELLSTNGAAWTLSDLLESGETYRDGPYYLSTTELGKITSSPSGPSVYIGYFMEDPTAPGTGGYVMLNPHYKDMQEAHQHRAYAMYSQPAGTQEVSGVTPVDTHAVQGFDTEAGDPTDHIPRLVAYGDWTGLTDVQYTIWLSNSSDPAEALGATSPPTSWNHYIHWLSDDPTEGSGAARVWSYESPVAIGTKGLVAALENPSGADWDDPYTIVVGADTEDKRTWIINVPAQTRGWLANKQRVYYTEQSATSREYSFLLFDGPFTAADDRISDLITVKCAKIYRLAYTGQPADTEKLTIGSIVFEFDNDDTITSDVAVAIGTTAEDTYINLLDAILAQNTEGVDASLDVDEGYLIIGAAAVSTGGITNGTLTNPGAGAGDLAGGTADFLVYDEYHRSLIPTAAYWDSAEYWVPKALSNGLSVMVVPYTTAGAYPPVTDAVAATDYWNVDFGSGAPNANFVYSMGMHQAMGMYYPPIPANASSLILNGVELDTFDLFPLDPTYRQGTTSLYWFSNLYGNVPWPRDWVSTSSVGSSVYAHNMLYHFVRMSVGNTGLVTSLQPAPGSPITVLQCDTDEPGTVGDLALDLDLQLSAETANLAGHEVVKEVQGQKLRKGPVVEKILSDGTVAITTMAGAPDGQGTVILGIENQQFGGDFEEVALENAKQELIGMFPYIRLLGWSTGGSNTPSGFVAKFRVPHTIAGDYRVVVYMTVFGEEDIPWAGGGAKEYAAIDFTYTILPDFSSVPTTPDGFPVGEAWNALNLTLPDGLMQSTVIKAEIPFGRYDNPQTGVNPIYAAYDPMLIHNNTAEAPATDEDRKIAQVLGNPFPVVGDLVDWAAVYPAESPVVRAGSLVGIRVARGDLLSGSTEYTGSIGFINLRWKLVLAT